MIAGLPLSFAFPMVLTALVLLPVIWWLLRLTPPRPQSELFPPLRILARLIRKEETPAKSPWWLTLLRLAMAAFVILAMAGPILNPREARLAGEGPVAIVIDNGWASAPGWDARRQTALSLVDEAEAANRPVIIVETAGGVPGNAEPVSAVEARSRLAGMEPRPLEPDHGQAAAVLSQKIRQNGPGSTILLSDGLNHAGTEDLAQAIASAAAQKAIVTSANDPVYALGPVRNDPEAMAGVILRARSTDAAEIIVEARDLKGIIVAQQNVRLEPGALSGEFRFTEPVEIRNQIVRLSLAGAGSAGSVQLLDDRYRRRLVGLVSGEGSDASQPLLSPLYYISRALSPFSDIREARGKNIVEAIPDLIGQGVSAIVLADVGNLPEETLAKLTSWVGKGGMLIRFAGPRLAASGDDPLLPVRLRQGDRDLGGALSWDTPKLVAPFEQGSPFFGLDTPSDVTVRRQVLALQDFGLEEKTWAVLEDGTPLVTAERREAGWIVLFHVNSDAQWSNLPISGTFVEMLRRVVNQSSSTGVTTAAGTDTRLSPLNVLNGRGELLPPDVSVKPLVLQQGSTPKVSADNPPGFYGTEDGFYALNLITSDAPLVPVDLALFSPSVEQLAYSLEDAVDLKPWLLALAALLLALDAIAVLWIAGALRLRPISRPAAAGAVILAVMLASALQAPGAHAQDSSDETDFAAALTTRLAYVITGDSTVDETSRAGLDGLSRFVASRTALEPGEPVGIDMATAELAFFPIIYWPVTVNSDLPDAATMARVDAYMKQGGTILFDTRDQGTGILGGTADSPEAQRLQLMLSNLDIPPLEPTPPDHVLTKAFYLLSSFPGRYSGGDLWVEQPATTENAGTRPVRAGDGVSSIIITSNDLAAAWAIDGAGQPIYPTIPSDGFQREMAFRAGVNIIMYAMTGNYKADQVHIPALLERLGQ
jgi:hypothetical protein